MPKLLNFGVREVSYSWQSATRCKCSESSFNYPDITRPFKTLGAPGSPAAFYSMVSPFTPLDITYQPDRLAVVPGSVAKAKAHRMTNQFFGVFEDFMLQDLFRYTREHGNKPSGCDVPTWSWAFLSTPINYIWLSAIDSAQTAKSPTRVLDVTVLQAACDSFGSPRAVWLKLSGRLIRTWLCELSGMQTSFLRMTSADIMPWVQLNQQLIKARGEIVFATHRQHSTAHQHPA